VADLVALPTPYPMLGTLRWRPPTTIFPGQVNTADLRLRPPHRLTPTAGARLSFGPEEIIEQGEPYPGRARRQGFILTTPIRDPVVLNTISGQITAAPPTRDTIGVIYAPEHGGPYPTILIVYPGLPETWEAISVALASGGFTVIAFTPLNFPDLRADTSDLLFLTAELTNGRLTPHAAPGRQCTAGGSFSTLWTFLLLRHSDAYRCVLSLGGISDAFLYREDWVARRITPDPRFAPVAEMMAAMGTPDQAPDLFLALSIIEHTDALPPAMLVHGHGDTTVAVNQSVRLAERLRAQGRPVELHLYNGMEHYLDASKPDPDNADLLARTIAFFRRHLT
jgi:dipeptidyl aminopeptidase/acylaminoacyl peptidase